MNGGLIDADRIALMKRGTAFLVNAARGAPS